jgi:hypothetical protein
MPEDPQVPVRPQPLRRRLVGRAETVASVSSFRHNVIIDQPTLPWGLDAYVGAQVPLGVK